MDANGNLLYATDGSTASAYEYDARNRLVKAGKLNYRYNPQGDRIELAQRGQVTRYVIDDATELSRVLMELDGEGNVKACYVYGLGLIGREDADGTYLSYHYDLRGSTTLLTDEQNRVTDRYTYGLYGELEQHEGVTVQPFAYNGRDGVMTDANGLYYMRARYYDPKLKRFLNRDVIRGEIQDGQTFNRYAYVNGNPVSYIDPLGLMRCETEGTGNGLETRGYKPQPGERSLTREQWRLKEKQGYQPTNRESELLLRDRPSRRVDNLSEWRRPIKKSDISDERRLFLGDHHVKVGPGKWRSLDGKRQYRVKPDDYQGSHGMGYPTVPNTPHVHFEFLQRRNNRFEVTKNIHAPLVE